MDWKASMRRNFGPSPGISLLADWEHSQGFSAYASRSMDRPAARHLQYELERCKIVMGGGDGALT
jgi:hypothetical protein